MTPGTDFGLRDLIWRLPLWFVLSLAVIPAITLTQSWLPWHPPLNLYLGAMALIPFLLAVPFGLFGRRMAVPGKVAVVVLALAVFAIGLMSTLWLGCFIGAMQHEHGSCI
jgi:hypothetical protein